MFASFDVPTWLYQFNYNMTGFERYEVLGDFHSAEIPFVFRNAWPAGRVFDADDWTVSDAISSYWANLATSHDPSNGPFSVPLAWPRYLATSDLNLQVGIGVDGQSGDVV